MTNLSIKLRAGIVPGINNNLCNEKIYNENIYIYSTTKRQKEVYQKTVTMQQVISSWNFQSQTKFLGLFQTRIRPCTYTTQLGSSIVFKCIFPKPSKMGNKGYIILLLRPLNFDPHFCEMMLICVSSTNCKLLQLSLILVCPHLLDLYRRKIFIYVSQEGNKVGP